MLAQARVRSYIIGSVNIGLTLYFIFYVLWECGCSVVRVPVGADMSGSTIEPPPETVWSG